MEEFIRRLCEINVIRFGKFRLSSGLETPVYVDMRLIVSYPDIMLKATALLKEKLKSIQFDAICGVPYAAVPIATATSLAVGIPLLLHRREVKSYGTGRRLEGDVCVGKKCLLMDDVIVAGTSILESAIHLRAVGIQVTDAVVLLDREQGGTRNLEDQGVKTHSLLKISDVLQSLLKMRRIKPDDYRLVREFLAENQVCLPTNLEAYYRKDCLKIPFIERSEYTKNDMTHRLFKVADSKKSNLCVNAESTNCDELINLLQKIGSLICMVTVDPAKVSGLAESAERLRQCADSQSVIIVSICSIPKKGEVCNGTFDSVEWPHVYQLNCTNDPEELIRTFFQIFGEKPFILKIGDAGSAPDAQFVEMNKKFLIGFISSGDSVTRRCDIVSIGTERRLQNNDMLLVPAESLKQKSSPELDSYRDCTYCMYTANVLLSV